MTLHLKSFSLRYDGHESALFMQSFSAECHL